MNSADLERDRAAAFLALRHCAIIRTRFDHHGFLSMYHEGLVDYRVVEGDEDVLDWFFLPEGERESRRLAA